MLQRHNRSLHNEFNVSVLILHTAYTLDIWDFNPDSFSSVITHIMLNLRSYKMLKFQFLSLVSLQETLSLTGGDRSSAAVPTRCLRAGGQMGEKAVQFP